MCNNKQTIKVRTKAKRSNNTNQNMKHEDHLITADGKKKHGATFKTDTHVKHSQKLSINSPRVHYSSAGEKR